MKPICIKCQRFYKCIKTGIYFLEGMPKGNNVQPGTIEAEKWVPYKLWSGDLFECAGCGSQTIVGVGRAALSEHFEPEFKHLVADLGATFQVNDC